jgi:hypothetical protein
MEYVERGWAKRTLLDSQGNVCMLGALGLACNGKIVGALGLACNGKIVQQEMSPGWNIRTMGGQEFDSSAISGAVEALAAKVKELGYLGGIPEMNDAPETTKQDCLNIMEKTAISLEEHGE